MAGSLLPQPKQTFTDDAGKPLNGGQIYTYAAGSLTPKATYQDKALTIANTNPVIANARGEVTLYGSGAYRLILKDKQGNTIWDQDNIESPASAIGAEVGGLSGASGASLVGFQQSGTAAVARTAMDKMREVVSVEDFGAAGDGATDDMGAFQRAANYLSTVGGGTLRLNKRAYYLSQYAGADVGGKVLNASIANGTSSKCLAIPGNVTVESACFSTLTINGGASSPFGYSFSVNVLAYPDGDDAGTNTDITAVNQAARQVTVASTAGLAVGMLVNIGRIGGNTAGIPNTPSQERSPQQFVTITAINGQTLTFAESFIHRFDAAQSLRLWYLSAGRSYPKNIYFKNVQFNAGASAPYILISRVVGTGFDNVGFGPRASFSIGTCQHVVISSLSIDMDSGNAGTSTIESTSDVKIEALRVNGNGNTSGIGGLFITDNCRAVQIGRASIYNMPKTGLALLYGVDAVIEDLALYGCGTTADPINDYFAALTIGFPATGAHASMDVANAAAYKARNIGNCSAVIKRIKVAGTSTVPVRVHDAEVNILDADIEFDGTSGSGAPFMLGQSGSRRSDAVYFPKGGQSRLKIGRVNVTTKAGTPAMIGYNNGIGGPFNAAGATVTAAAASGATTITVSDPSRFKVNSGIYFMDEAAQAIVARSCVVTAISGSTLTLSPALPVALVNGQSLWTYTPQRELTQNVQVGEFILDGVRTPLLAGESAVYPDFQTGAGPYTWDMVLAAPGRGEWLLDVTLISLDKAHFVSAQYAVMNSVANTTYPLQTIVQVWKNKVRTAVDVSAVAMASGSATVTLQSASSGKGTTATYKWTPVRPIFSEL